MVVVIWLWLACGGRFHVVVVAGDVCQVDNGPGGRGWWWLFVVVVVMW